MALAVVLAVALVAMARTLGWLERLELSLHDQLVGLRQVQAQDSPVTVILESEIDLKRFGHPLSDSILAGVITRLVEQGATVIAIDKYRDIPVPPGEAELARVIEATPNLLWVETFGETGGDGIQPPVSLRGTSRAACGDVVDDADGRVRRAIMQLDSSERSCEGLGFAVAKSYLRAHGAQLRLESTPTEYMVRAGASTLPRLATDSGPYATADMAGYQVPLQYRRSSIPTLGLGELWDGKVAPERIRGRAVIVGSEAESLRDIFDVPPYASSAAGRLPGATLHAHVASELIDGARDPRALLRLSASWVAFALVVFSATASAVVIAGISSITVGATMSMGIAAALALLAIFATLNGIAFPPLPGMVAAVLSGGIMLGLRAWQERRARGELMAMFGRQVSPEVASAIWEQRSEFFQNGRIPAQVVEVTILFADIRGYSTITEVLPPEAMIDWLNRAIEAMTHAVHRNRGVVVRYVGDQVMALFGSPVPRHTRKEIEEDAAAAVRCGLDMGRLLDALNTSNATAGLPAARVRVGIYSGTVTQGGLGPRERFEFTVLGDAVNTAARLESYPGPDDGSTARVLIGETTRKLCGDIFRTQEMGALGLKGKNQKVVVFRVLPDQ